MLTVGRVSSLPLSQVSSPKCLPVLGAQEMCMVTHLHKPHQQRSGQAVQGGPFGEAVGSKTCTALQAKALSRACGSCSCNR